MSCSPDLRPWPATSGRTRRGSRARGGSASGRIRGACRQISRGPALRGETGRRPPPFFCHGGSAGVGLKAMITNRPGIELVDVRLDHPRGGAPLVCDASVRVTGGERVLIVGAAGVG